MNRGNRLKERTPTLEPPGKLTRKKEKRKKEKRIRQNRFSKYNKQVCVILFPSSSRTIGNIVHGLCVPVHIVVFGFDFTVRFYLSVMPFVSFSNQIN